MGKVETIRVSESTKNILDDVVRIHGLRTYDEAIRELARIKSKTMYGFRR